MTETLQLPRRLRASWLARWPQLPSRLRRASLVPLLRDLLGGIVSRLLLALARPTLDVPPPLSACLGTHEQQTIRFLFPLEASARLILHGRRAGRRGGAPRLAHPEAMGYIRELSSSS